MDQSTVPAPVDLNTPTATIKNVKRNGEIVPVAAAAERPAVYFLRSGESPPCLLWHGGLSPLPTA